MGGLAGVLAFTSTAMPTEGWQIRVSAWLQHASSVTVDALSWLPGWALAAVLVLGLAFLLRRALRTRTAPHSTTSSTTTHLEEVGHDQQDIR